MGFKMPAFHYNFCTYFGGRENFQWVLRCLPFTIIFVGEDFYGLSHNEGFSLV